MPNGEDQNDLEVKKVFENKDKELDENSETKANPCNENCDCYVELEVTRAAGIAGYRLGM